MVSFWTTCLTIAFATLVAAGGSKGAGKSCRLSVINSGEAAGQIKNVNGVQVYHSYPPHRNYDHNSTKAVLFVTDFYGIASLNNKLVADSIARAGYPVIMPDLFNGDPVSTALAEGPALDLAAWRARHPTFAIDRIIESTITYIRNGLSASKLGAVGYCLGGKHVPRAMAAGGGIDVGFIAHPANLTAEEIRAIAGPISIAAGELDALFNSTGRRAAEDILTARNATYQTNLYSGAPHGFAVRANLNISRQRFAKEASFLQAVTWFDNWL
ncbi:alpha/beta-hydrolase [Lentithecium fluviatile CBS 122367]|uniref:Alpha/beta-hydrolase n=1 Tax=Lentithecium fluviatile CBS 122367 TaxID=1168545 RepID=A0A6G1ICU1_9PLEO|nr:alpha/beta-hydrolase [Lentithecium fluviatile CBS 122367]